jgi:hypothetical protein
MRWIEVPEHEQSFLYELFPAPTRAGSVRGVVTWAVITLLAWWLFFG